MDLARAPRRRPLTARKKGSGYENGIASFDHIFLKCSEFSSARSKDLPYYTGRLYILAKMEHQGRLSNIQVRILFCFLYNRAILKGNIYYLHS